MRSTDIESKHGIADNMIESFLLTSPILICIVGQDDRIIKTSALVSKVLGFSTSELAEMATCDLDVAGNTPSLTQTVHSCRQHGTIDNSEIAIRRKEGDVLKGLALASTWKDKNENLICGIVIIEESRFPDGNKNAEIISELRRKEDLKDEFIAIASHELRTPIQPILGLALLAKRGKITQEDAWDRVLKESRRLQQLANDILDVSRIESGTLPYKMEKLRLAEIAEHVVSVQKSLETDDVTLRLEMDEKARNVECEVDRARITQALMNILGNAMKFTKKGEVLVQMRADMNHRKCDIIVKDKAGGVPESIISSLFGKFVTKKAGESESHGSGLGLYIARSIIMKHRGIIYLCNSEEGATFVIRLPLITASS